MIFDDVICFMVDGMMKVVCVVDKVFMGCEIFYVVLLLKDGDIVFYMMIYQDKESGKVFVKCF